MSLFRSMVSRFGGRARPKWSLAPLPLLISPLGWREYWRIRSENRAYRKARRNSQGAIDSLQKRMNAARDTTSQLIRDPVPELDAARAQFDDAFARLQAAQADLLPATDEAREARLEEQDSLRHRARS